MTEPATPSQGGDFGVDRPVQNLNNVLVMLANVMDRMTIDTEIGRILMPGPTYLGIWARDTGIEALGLSRLGRWHLSGELLERYWSFQIDERSDPNTFVFRNKGRADWRETDSYRPTRRQLLREAGAFPTCVYIQTPEFPAGTREIYTERADLDSVAWLIVALEDYGRHSGDIALLQRLQPRVDRAITYLRKRDADGDSLLEQGPNQDWADVLLRRGKVSYTQAVWFRALQASGDICSLLGDEPGAERRHAEAAVVRAAINATLLTSHGYYANWTDRTRTSLRRSLDTALLIAFGVAEPGTEQALLAALDTLGGPFGPAVIEPGYAAADIGPSKPKPGQYHNEGVWPWIAAYQALAYSKAGDEAQARRTIDTVLGHRPSTIHEWIDNVNGERHHADFATGAGALAWAITEADLGRWPGREQAQGTGTAAS